MAVAASLALAGCITVPVPGAGTSTTPAPAAAKDYVERLKAAPAGKPADQQGGRAQFVTKDRNIACVFTSSRAGNLDQPWEANNYADTANAKAPTVPVVNCELAAYPAPVAADVTDTCSGTHIGYLGGTALLSPAAVSYGGCRSGPTAVEAAFGPGGTANGTLSRIPVLAAGTAMDSLGYRCAPLDDGVACANLAAGIGFFVSAGSYELLKPGSNAPASTAPASTAPAR
ncbi:hypothetical protein AL755_04830 [Arthrobacter sp. ERGS1:01]|nr:hypothetical protein AL755_04830 [Arthrobacter sp. ERGS1:01]